MDVAYDHIQEELLPEDEEGKQQGKEPSAGNFNAELQDAYKAISTSAWGARLGGFFGTVKKQSEHYYEEARHEYEHASEQAAKGITGLRSSIISRTRSLSLNNPQPNTATPSPEAPGPSEDASEASTERPESLSADIVKEAESMLSRFRSEAAKRLKDIERAEDAADEALLKFGNNIRNFLRDAVTIAPPDEGEGEGGASGSAQVLFESRDAEGKRVIHTTRFEAQLHVIHSNLDSFAKDPASPEYASWAAGFDIDERTEAISKDLETYEELRRAMEKLVPEKVEYGQFWKRYYFLRHVIETEEQRRREMLKGAVADTGDEEVSWDNDSEDEEDNATTPNQSASITAQNPIIKPTSSPDGSNPASGESTDKDETARPDLLKPGAEPRRSNDQHSQADSDASYDLVSGATSRTPGSPKDDKKKEVVAEESDEDWE